MDDYPKPRRRRRGLLAVLMAGTAIMAAVGVTFSLAVFTSSAVVGSNGFTTGTIVLGVSVGGNPAPPAIILTAGSMMPGDSIPTLAPGQPVLISNSGTAQLRYAISGTSTDADVPLPKHLNTVLTIIVRQPDGNAGNSCALMTGTMLFTGVVPTTGVNMVGDPTQGFQAIPGLGDRTLNSGASETLCFKASLPLGTGNAFQGATSTYTFTFAAEQTQSNP